MADGPEDEDLFADLYDGEDADPETAASAPKIEPNPEPAVVKQDESTVVAAAEPMQTEAATQDYNNQGSYNDDEQNSSALNAFNGGGFGSQQNGGGFGNGGTQQRPIGSKEDGTFEIQQMLVQTAVISPINHGDNFTPVFLGYRGESAFDRHWIPVVKYMHIEEYKLGDGHIGVESWIGSVIGMEMEARLVYVRISGTEQDIDPKRAIPKDEQERTAKIFVGGVSQEATEPIFREFFEQFGTVLDATLMMDKDTGRPRGFGFVTFDGDAAVDRTLEGPLAILGKGIEVKRAQPRGNMRDDEGPRNGKFVGRNGKQEGFQSNNNFGVQDQSSGGSDQNPNNMSPAMMAQYWQRMQQYFQLMQQQMASGMGSGAGGMNMATMQQNPAMMQQMMQRQGMNPVMMQQMQAMQQQQQQQGGGFTGMTQNGSPMNGGVGTRPGFNAQEQLMFEQQKYERQALGGGPAVPGGNQNTWDGMYEGAEAPTSFNNQQMRGGFGGRGRGGRASQQPTPQPAGQAPAGAPTGPKNAGRAGANYRGGGRGGARGGGGAGSFHPYSRPGAGS
nr:putative rna-binding protein [Quercus suber]